MPRVDRGFLTGFFLPVLAPECLFCLKVTFIYFCGVWMWGGVQVCVGQRTACWS